MYWWIKWTLPYVTVFVYTVVYSRVCWDKHFYLCLVTGNVYTWCLPWWLRPKWWWLSSIDWLYLIVQGSSLQVGALTLRLILSAQHSLSVLWWQSTHPVSHLGGGHQNINPPQSELIIALEMTLTLCTLSTNLYRTKIVSEKWKTDKQIWWINQHIDWKGFFSIEMKYFRLLQNQVPPAESLWTIWCLNLHIFALLSPLHLIN